MFPENPGSTDPFPIKPNPDPAQGIYTLTDVRVGAHPSRAVGTASCSSSRTVDGVPGAHPGGIVEYVDEASQCGSGMPVDVEGRRHTARALRFDPGTQRPGSADDRLDDIDGPGNSILQAVSYCDFEGVVQWAIGVPAEQNFKVTFLANPSRVVIDVKWP